MNKAIKTCSFIMPGEFEKQKSVWIVWPHNKKDWPGYFNSIPGTIANIISKLSTEYFSLLKESPVILTMPEVPEPTSFALTKGFYIRAGDIASKCLDIMAKKKIGCLKIIWF